MAGQFRELVVKDPRLPFGETDEEGNALPKRSPKWPSVRKEWLAENPTCLACGKTANKLVANWTMQVHHKQPFHLFPNRELDKTNFATLCGNPRCHLGDGHCGNFKKWNPYLLEMIALRKKLYALAPKTKKYDHNAFLKVAQEVFAWFKNNPRA